MNYDFTDEDCIDAIKQLDNLQDDLKDWDMDFVESNMRREHFTDKQKEQIERMCEEYGI